MAGGELRPLEKRTKRRCLAVLVMIIVNAGSPSHGRAPSLTASKCQSRTLGRKTATLQEALNARCEGFKRGNREKIWGAVEQACVGRDPCEVPMGSYDPLIAVASFQPACNRMMPWSKTKDGVHDFTEKKDHFGSLEETLLGSVLNDVTCCGKESSSETFTPGSPGWTDWENSPAVRSLWSRAAFRASAAVSSQQERTLRQKTATLQETFIARCERFQGHDCEKIWAAFVQSYVGRDPCKVPMESYDPLIAVAPFQPACNRMMLWSKTNDVVHDFTRNRNCFATMQETLLGSALNGLTWCGKEGSNETFTTGCPGWTDCENNPVRSFWNKASAAQDDKFNHWRCYGTDAPFMLQIIYTVRGKSDEFADAACGDVTVMLNGSIASPFSPTSIFATIEVKGLNNSTRVKSVNIVLVTQQNDETNCTNASLKDLQKELDKGIKYSCKEVSKSRIQECSSNSKNPCGACW